MNRSVTEENQRQLLDQILMQHKEKVSACADDEQFEIFVCEQVLRNYKLENEDLLAGMAIAGGNEGQLDSFYLFVNGNPIAGVVEEGDLSDYRKNIVIDLILIQSKREPSFKETVVQKMADTIVDIFDLSRSQQDLAKLYNSELVAAIMRFRDVRRILSTKFPNLNIEIVYATRGSTSEIHKKVKDRSDNLIKELAELSPTQTTIKFSFLGALELIQIASLAPKTERPLRYSNLLMAGGRGGFICLTRLNEYFAFITENGELLYHLFESNVRDYQRDVEVNKEIQESLKNPTDDDFWWLNNGITIIGSKVYVHPDHLVIDEPQIVNGLQTSQEVFNYFHGKSGTPDERRIQVRVIESASPDRVIKATNRQTAIGAEQFYATEEVHRNIEKIFPAHGLYYDRRKNYWQNRDKPRNQVVGIKELTQDVTAILLGRPDSARARPSQAFAKANVELRNKIFSNDYPLTLFVNCVKLQKAIEAFLRTNNIKAQMRTDLRFYVSFAVSRIVLGKSSPTAEDISNVDVSKIPASSFEKGLAEAKKAYELLGATESAAKGPELLEEIKKSLNA